MTTTQKWTKELVQKHAKTAVQVELYTLPFYLTALTSISDSDKEHIAYKRLLSISIEEMLHLLLASNLCVALDTQPEFTAPNYNGAIEYLKPDNPETKDHKLINASLDALNEKTLNLMLDIETPSGLGKQRHPEKGIWKIIDRVEDALEARWNLNHHQTPNYPYDTIGDMYDALIAGIKFVGTENFTWASDNQVTIGNWDNNNFPIKITKFEDAEEAVKTISLQGEGTTNSVKYLIPKKYCLEGDVFDSNELNEYSHYERLLDIKKEGLPNLRISNNDGQNQAAQQEALQNLQTGFSQLLTALDAAWNKHKDINNEDINFWGSMTNLLYLSEACWDAGVIPKWSSN